MKPIDDIVEMVGRLVLQLLRPDGTEQIVEIDNLVVDTGKAMIADRLLAVPTIGAPSHMAVGTSGTAPAANNIALGQEVGRVAFANAVRAGAVVTYTAVFGPGVGTGALVEAGLLNGAAGGSMLARTTFAVINKAAGDILNVTWTVTVA